MQCITQNAINKDPDRLSDRVQVEPARCDVAAFSGEGSVDACGSADAMAGTPTAVARIRQHRTATASSLVSASVAAFWNSVISGNVDTFTKLCVMVSRLSSRIFSQEAGNVFVPPEMALESS